MGKQRSPDRQKAFELYKNSNGNIALVDIAKQLNLPVGTVRGWKNKDKWDNDINGTFRKNERNVPFNDTDVEKNSTLNTKKNTNQNDSGNNKKTKTNTQNMKRYGNKNAVGNKGGSGTLKNKNALTTGEHETIFFGDIIDEEEKAILKIDIEVYVHIVLEIQLLTIREVRMMKRIRELEKKNTPLGIASSTKVNIVDIDADGGKSTRTVNNTTAKPILDEVLKIENALTNVQGRKLKALELLNKYELDAARLGIEKERLKIYRDKVSGIIDIEGVEVDI